MADQTSGSIDIAAPPEAVTAVVPDVEQHPARVDSTSSAEVLTAQDGRPETVRVGRDHAAVRDAHVLRCSWAPAVVSLRLVEGHLPGTTDGSCTVEPLGSGSTVTYRPIVDATLPMIGLFRRQAEETDIAGALRALERRVEG